MSNKELLLVAINAAIDGGKEILEVYNSADFEVEVKDDNSPLTLADKKAHLKIMEYLNQHDVPVLSEEGRSIAYEERKGWDKLWIVDPLDGTKEFIKRNGEFTVNIALIENGSPSIGVIYVPVKDVLYFGLEGFGAYKCESITASGIKNLDELVTNGLKLPQTQSERNFVAVGSRSHMSVETQAYFNELKEEHGEVDVVSMGSSLKICLVADGTADVYPRFAPTMEWDTAAGQGIAQAAGKTVIDYKTKEPMKYNREELLNNWFIVR